MARESAPAERGAAEVSRPGSGRPPLREAQKQFTRQLLLEAAAETFARQGYLRTTVNDIVASASTTRATFYQHFGGKREIVNDFLQDLAVRGRELEGAPYSSDNFPVTHASLRAWLVNKIAFVEENRVVLEAIEDACAEDAELRAQWQSAVRDYAEYLAQHLERSGCRYPARVYALLLTLQTERFLSFWLVRGGDSVDAEAALETLTGIWADALGIPPAKRDRLGRRVR